MREEAIILTPREQSSQVTNLAKLFRFFGISHSSSGIAELLSRGESEPSEPKRLFCSSDIFNQLLGQLDHSTGARLWWQAHVHSVFVYAGSDAAVLQAVLRKVTGDTGAVMQEAGRSCGEFSVSDGLDEFGGVMAGLRIEAAKLGADTKLAFYRRSATAADVISRGSGATLVRASHQEVPVLLSTSAEVIDLDCKLPSGLFDLREHVLTALPFVLFVKWAFSGSCWHSAEVNACLIIDDPVLKPTDGFLNFKELLRLTKRHRFSANIAFIPWNWRRSAPEVIRLFRENPDQLSISVHGCDHVRAEFGSPDQQRLHGKAEEALERMERHEANTGLRHDRVMVFPQGVFSEAAMSAIKRTELMAAVNNDTLSADPSPRAITIADVWDIAVMRYSDFPLFTRRYPWEGVENFAFDILLGKPAISIIHHDYCSDHCQRLVQFVDQLNALKCEVAWRSLGEVVRRSCRMREVSPSLVEVEMYASELRLENRSNHARTFAVKKRESNASAVKNIDAGLSPLSWRVSDGSIEFEIHLKAWESMEIRVRFYPPDVTSRSEENLSYKFQTMLRRHLCEIRDNYVAKGRFTLESLLKGNH
ncbi:MAG: hypothetical protein M3505_09570 [Verrucomicrobiota bacterium]|nr:hypothetical protein [Verrucomicrobiota bacterium]